MIGAAPAGPSRDVVALIGAAGLRVARHEALHTQGGRPRQEDAHRSLMVDGRLIVAVADGLGGVQNGDAASQVAVDAVLSALHRHRPWGISDPAELRKGYVRAFQDAQAFVRGTGGKTTLVVAVVDPLASEVTFAWCGDSSALALRRPLGKRGWRRVFLTPRHGEGNVVFRYLGGHFEWRPDVARVPLQPGDAVLIATDGFDEGLGIDGASPHRARGALRALGEWGDVTPLAWLERRARRLGSTDNATAHWVEFARGAVSQAAAVNRQG